MANVFVNEDSLSAIADAIRDKLNTEDTYKPGEMADAIESISGGSVNNQNKTVHPSSSDQSITADTGYSGLGTVSVKAVTMSNLSAANIVEGVTVKIGDADDDDRIASVTGSASGGITPTGTKTITSNGTNIDVYSYAKADVAVPNSYSASDEGKVVSNGALVAQTSDTVTTNDTYDTTLINSLTVNVSGGGDGTPTGGTFTMESNDKTFTLTVPSGITNFVFYATDFNEGVADGGWNTVGGIWFNSLGKSFVRYNNANQTVSELTVSLNGTTLSCTAQYNLRTEKTYKWYAW